MSYSSQTKEELCRLELDSVCCLLAELSGIVSAAGSVISVSYTHLKRFKRSKNQEAKRPLIPLPLLKAAAKQRGESEG